MPFNSDISQRIEELYKVKVADTTLLYLGDEKSIMKGRCFTIITVLLTVRVTYNICDGRFHIYSSCKTGFVKAITSSRENNLCH